MLTDEELTPKESDLWGIVYDSDEERKAAQRDTEGGKLIPQQEKASFQFFNQEVVIRQQLNKCGGIHYC